MIDILGHPVAKGDTILTNEYGSPTMSVIAIVEKVAKKSCILYMHVPVVGAKYMRKLPHQVVVVNQQLAYNKKHFPENAI
jgi:hypothetical protein